MKITEVRLGMISVPLRVPFKTALRSVNSVEDVVVEIHTDTGAVGYGEAPPTGVITGDTTGSIIGAIRDHIAKTIVGRDVDDFEDLMIALNACIQKNTSAKAAVDMALWDLYGQLYRVPVYKLMGGARKSIVTDITISVNDPDEMVRDAQNAIARGYDCLKVKVGKEPEKDIARLSAIRAAVPKETLIRIDANQGWTPKEAVRILNGMQERGLDIEFVEQPVQVLDRTFHITAVSWGNPHCAMYVDSVADLDVEGYGKTIEHMTSIFPNKTNVTFVEFVRKDYIKIREWERGTGETIGCGTGCSTAVVAGVLTGRTDRKVTVEQIGGPLLIEWDEKTNHLFMTGPSHTVFEAEIDASHVLEK